MTARSILAAACLSLFACAGSTGPQGGEGPTGAAGAGAPGATGVTGPEGATGPMGATGATGTGQAGGDGGTLLVGPTGPTGPMGATGATGPAGTAGGPGSLEPSSLDRGGAYTDVARGAPATVTTGTTLVGLGPTSEFAETNYAKSVLFPSSLTIDLGSLRVGLFEIVFESAWRGDVTYIPASSYQLAYSPDGTTWTQVPAVTPSQGDVFIHNLSPTVSARYLSLKIVGAASGSEVHVSMLRALSYLAGDSSAVSAQRIYGAPITLPSGTGSLTLADPTTSGIFGSNSAGNLHLDADGTKGDGHIYLNWYQGGKGVIFGNGAQGTAASVDSGGNATFKTINTLTLFDKGAGDNGSVSCDTYCNGSQWGPIGTCVSAKVVSNSSFIPCTYNPGNASTLLDCFCSSF